MAKKTRIEIQMTDDQLAELHRLEELSGIPQHTGAIRFAITQAIRVLEQLPTPSKPPVARREDLVGDPLPPR